MGRNVLLIASLWLAGACVLESRAVGPLDRSLDGGFGGAGGIVGTGGVGGMAGTGGVGGIGGAFSPGSRAVCETCVGDADCGDLDHRCVEMRYLNQPYPNAQTGFCLKIAVPLSEGPPPVYDCQAPYVTVLVDRPSLSGGEVESYCGIREDFTTCAAVRAHAEAWPCTRVGDDACPDGGFCDFVKTETAGWQEFCTYACDLDSECQGPGGEACAQDGYCGY